MGKIIKNILLMLFLFAIILMAIGVLFYEYLPTRVEVKKANKYEPNKKITTALATIKEEEKELFGSKPSTGGSGLGVVIQAYSLDAGDLAVYEQADLYVSGRSDPFAPISSGSGSITTPGGSSTGTTTKPNTNTTQKPSSGNNINTNTLTEVKDNTILNSGNSK